MILNQGQGHLNWYKNVEFSSVYHDIKSELHQFWKVKISAKWFFFLHIMSNTSYFPWINESQSKVESR